jgi:hypothetical protein
MNNHIPDTGKMVCPHCGAEPERTGLGRRACRFACDSILWDDGALTESFQCVTYQRDQLRARVEELERWIRGLETHPDSDGQHKGVDPDWQWVAKGRQIYIGKPKPEGLR